MARSSEGRTPRVIMYAKYILPRYSGAGRQALSLATALRGEGVDVSFLTEATSERPEDYELDGFRVRTFVAADESVSVHPTRGLALVKVLRQERRRGPIVFHAHSAYPEASAMGAAARLIGVPSILKVTLHRSDVDCSGSRVIGRIHRQLLRRQSAIVAISSEIRDELRVLGVDDARIQEIPNGVDTERFRPADEARRRAAREQLGVDPDGPVALFVGILNARKNVHWLLDRWEGRGHRRGTLILAGPAAEDAADSIRRRVETMSADPASGVRWIGVRDRVEDVYAAADLLLLPSEAEGMPNVVLEAMAAGVPALVTDGSGVRDLMGQGSGAGMRVPFGDAAAFDAALAKLVARPEELREMGAAARRRAEASFSLRAVAARYRRLYDAAVRGL